MREHTLLLITRNVSVTMAFLAIYYMSYTINFR